MPDPQPPASWLARAFREGKSPTAALKEFREAGGAVRRQTWFRVAGEVRSALANRDRLMGMDYSLLPDQGDFTPWSAGRPGSYLYQIDVPYRDRDTGEVFRAPYSVITDRVISPQAAIDEALARMDAALDEKYDYQVLQGGVLTGLYTMGAA